MHSCIELAIGIVCFVRSLPTCRIFFGSQTMMAISYTARGPHIMVGTSALMTSKVLAAAKSSTASPTMRS